MDNDGVLATNGGDEYIGGDLVLGVVFGLTHHPFLDFGAQVCSLYITRPQFLQCLRWTAFKTTDGVTGGVRMVVGSRSLNSHWVLILGALYWTPGPSYIRCLGLRGGLFVMACGPASRRWNVGCIAVQRHFERIWNDMIQFCGIARVVPTYARCSTHTSNGQQILRWI